MKTSAAVVPAVAPVAFTLTANLSPRQDTEEEEIP